MAFQPVCMLAQLPPGTLADLTIDGKSVALCNVDGEIHAMDGVCPHRNGVLGQGALHGHMVVCPWHAWEFDCRTGQHDYNPTIVVPVYPVRVEGGEILVDLE